MHTFIRHWSSIAASLVQRVLPVLALAILVAIPVPSPGSVYRVSPLVSDVSGLAPVLDSNLANPWGIAASPTGPFWIADNRTGLSTIYSGSGQPESLVVSIAPAAGGLPPGSPTGVAFNGTSSFELTPGSPARFLFATEDGTISGWNPLVNPTSSVRMVDNSASGAVYKGLALASRAGQPTLYATNFRNGSIEVFDGTFSPLVLPGRFTDPGLPAGFAPFGISVVGGNLVVTYAKQDPSGQDNVPGPGLGFVDLFDTDGNMIRRLVSQGALNSPWGIAQAPGQFGEFSDDLLVGNFGDGRINAFDPATGDFRGALSDSTGAAVALEGLWGLTFGNGGAGGDPHTLYFTAGISAGGEVEDHGLFGAIAEVGEPTPVLLVSLDAAVEASGVRLSWRMMSDVEALAFHVRRCDDGVSWHRLDQDPIQGSSDGSYEYLDETAEAGAAYLYRIDALDPRGGEIAAGTLRVQVTLTSDFSLRAFPTPMKGLTTVAFALPRAGAARLDVFDLRGRLVAILAERPFAAGVHRLDWAGVDLKGNPLPSGTYFLRLEAQKGIRTTALSIIR